MSSKPYLIVMPLAVFFFGCAKNQSQNRPGPDLITQAHAFFDKNVIGAGKVVNTNNFRAIQPRSINWSVAVVTHFSNGDAVTIPVSYGHDLYVSNQSAPGHVYRLGDLASLVISRDSIGKFNSAVVTFVPDSANSQNDPHGIYFVEDWQGNTIYSPVHLGSPSKPQPVSSGSSSKEADYIQGIQVCDEIEGYNYSPADPDDGIAWSETTCTTYGFATDNPGGGIPASRLGSLPITRYIPPLEVIVAPPTSPISSIADYFKCFTNGSSPDFTFTVQVCVDQPDPGTRQPWTLTSGGVAGTSAASNPLNVGHTFLVLTENSQGNIISRNVGFYPSSPIYPISGFTSAQGVLNNDDGHQYNISLTISVSPTQFFGILNYVSLGNNTGFDYDLNTDNCTTFCLNALGSNGINLPNTKGTWATGSGNDPR